MLSKGWTESMSLQLKKKHKAVITDSKTFDEIHGIVYQFNISVNVIY